MKKALKVVGYAVGVYTGFALVLWTCVGLANFKKEKPDDLGEWLVDEALYLFTGVEQKNETKDKILGFGRNYM